MSNEIEQLLPHRDPFLFIDRLIEVGDERIVAERCFGPDEWFFKGHFPEYPVVTGVILVETLAQAGGAGVIKNGSVPEQIFFLAAVTDVKFRRQVRPGDVVRLEVENIKISRRMMKQRGKAFVGDELAAEASWMCMMSGA